MSSSVKFSGRLYTDRHTFQVAGQRLNDNARKAVIKAARAYEDALREILFDGLGLFNIPDTSYYRRKKQMFMDKHGLEMEGPWVKTGALKDTITTKVTEQGGKRARAWAGFENGPHYSGLSVQELVEIMDARFPLLEPAWEYASREINDILADIGTGIFR